MNAIPWYQSPVMIGAVVSIVSQLVVLFGLNIAPDVLSKDVDAVFQVLALAAAGYAAWKRKTSAVQPVTLTQKRADTHPATLASAPPATQPTGVP